VRETSADVRSGDPASFLILMGGDARPGSAIWMEPSLSSQIRTSTETVFPSSLTFIGYSHQTSPENYAIAVGAQVQ